MLLKEKEITIGGSLYLYLGKGLFGLTAITRIPTILPLTFLPKVLGSTSLFLFDL